ncbi:WG repeat-containing protein [[Flexibacter] sp. ATCC 35103]|uniref:WG repeat-containing protein n=1 Tax=[Flexibacter] sp. ATCC 35103 TaxID=1937528 RepID=UPI0009D35673|nr:WG repeat-containing protein [[Flexibacter] sp. ATCC 35103]OMQ13543.1 hypothetical protein BXU01_03435 [[Flexibacter] sp. ATCC 35103]
MKQKRVLIFVVIFLKLNMLGQTINKFPFEMSVLEYFSGNNNVIVPILLKEKFYYIDNNTKAIKIDKGFDVAYPFINNVALVKQKEKYGLINLKGDYIVEPTYKYFQIASYQKILIFKNEHDKEICYDYSINEFVSDYIYCAEPLGPEIITFQGLNGKYGIKNLQNKIIAEPLYDSVLVIKKKFIVVKLNNKIGIIDNTNKILIPFKYDDFICSRDENPKIISLKKKKHWTYLYDFKKAVDSKYESVENIAELISEKALSIVKNKNKYNILFKDGSVLPIDYDWIAYNGKVAISGNKVYQIYDFKSFILYCNL